MNKWFSRKAILLFRVHNAFAFGAMLIKFFTYMCSMSSRCGAMMVPYCVPYIRCYISAMSVRIGSCCALRAAYLLLMYLSIKCFCNSRAAYVALDTMYMAVNARRPQNKNIFMKSIMCVWVFFVPVKCIIITKIL